MIKAKINGEMKEFDAENFNNFGEFLKEVIPQNHIIKVLKINNKDIPVTFVEELKEAKIDKDIEIEIEYISVVSFVKETLRDVVGYIEKVESLLPEVSKDVIVGNQQGLKAIKDLSEGISAMDSLKNSTYQIVKLTDEELNITTRPEEVVKVLKDFLMALETKDMIELSDMLENKIPVVLQYYKEYFTKALHMLSINN